MRIKPFKALYPDTKMIVSPDSFFGVMKREFPHYLKNSFFKRSKDTCYFLYRIEGKMSSTGLICSTAVEDIIDGKILKHEHTLARKEQMMLDLALQRNAMIKPVLLAHPFIQELADIYNVIAEEEKPFVELEFKEEKSVHRLWKIVDTELQERIESIFNNQINQAYIADGHHRVSTGIQLNRTRKNTTINYSDLLSIYLSFDDLRIYDYNRIVDILKEVSPTRLMCELSKYFKIKRLPKLKKPSKKHEITFCIKDEVYSLKWKKKYLKSSSLPVLLDADLLNQYVFQSIFKMEDVRTDARISYVSGMEGMSKIQSNLLKEDHSVAFLLYPIQEEELMAVAEAGLTLPPKSTWFEPRIKNAVIAQEFK